MSPESTAEFDHEASAIAERIPELPESDRIAAACRGSGNPAALAWLAECVKLGRSSTVIDVGAGIGGPAAWLSTRYGCRVVNLEPAPLAAHAATGLFGTPTVCGSADHLPVRDGAFDVGLLLGVLSVVEQPDGVLREVLRVSGALGVMDYCSTTAEAVDVGGSSFLPPEALHRMIEDAGWQLVQHTSVTLPAPRAWSDALQSIDIPPEPSEVEVTAAIQRGALAPILVHACR